MAQRGYSLVALTASIAISMILMAGALPAWRYVMKNEREEELIFRGGQIADAVERFRKKNGGALPTSLEVLVKGRFLRKLYTDPMTADGKWRLVRQGEGPGKAPGGGPRGGPGGPAGGGGPTGGAGGLSGGAGGLSGGAGGLSSGSGLGDSGPGRVGLPGAAGTTTGGIVGVASVNNDKGLRLFNGRERYSEWLFVAGQQRVVGKQAVGGPPRGAPGGGIPGGAGGVGPAGPGGVGPVGPGGPGPVAPPTEPEGE